MNIFDLHELADACPFDFYTSIINPLSDDGFLGVGGDLSVSTLLHAYRSGAFPWFDNDDPICWWSPPTRCVINPKNFQPSKSLVRYAKKQNWTLTTNQDFSSVIHACSLPRSYSQDTWITQSMKSAYQKLHDLGAAVSVEVWEGKPENGQLIGGLYGVNIGGLFCGESMFHHKTNASKTAFWALMIFCQQNGIKLVDCQLENSHLMSLGATLITKEEFLTQIRHLIFNPDDGIYNKKIQLSITDL